MTLRYIPNTKVRSRQNEWTSSYDRIWLTWCVWCCGCMITMVSSIVCKSVSLANNKGWFAFFCQLFSNVKWDILLLYQGVFKVNKKTFGLLWNKFEQHYVSLCMGFCWRCQCFGLTSYNPSDEVYGQYNWNMWTKILIWWFPWSI